MKKKHNIQNVGKIERTASVIAGGLLLYSALRNRQGLLKTFGAGMAIYRGMSGYCPAYDMMGKKPLKLHNVNLRTEMTIAKPVEQVFAFWRNFENLPLFMSHLKKVKVIDGRTSEWKANLPGGVGSVKWKAVIVHEIPNEVIGWTSTEGSEIDTAGKVTFESVFPNSTKIEVLLSYRPTSGKLAEHTARFFSPAFERTIKNDISELKDYLESGYSINHPTDFRATMI